MYIFFLALLIFSKEFSLSELKNEVKDKTQIYGDKITKAQKENKNSDKKDIPSIKERVEANIIKNNNFINKIIIIKDVFFVKQKEVKLVFRDYQGLILEAKTSPENIVYLKKGMKYKIKGELLDVGDITILKFIEAIPIH